MRIEILYFEGCPNHMPTVERVKRTVANLGVQAQIEEVEVASPEQVEQLRFLGSPPVCQTHMSAGREECDDTRRKAPDHSS